MIHTYTSIYKVGAFTAEIRAFGEPIGNRFTQFSTTLHFSYMHMSWMYSMKPYYVHIYTHVHVHVHASLHDVTILLI